MAACSRVSLSLSYLNQQAQPTIFTLQVFAFPCSCRYIPYDLRVEIAAKHNKELPREYEPTEGTTAGAIDGTVLQTKPPPKSAKKRGPHLTSGQTSIKSAILRHPTAKEIDEFNRLLIHMLVYTGLPLSWPSHPMVREWLQKVRPGYVTPGK